MASPRGTLLGFGWDEFFKISKYAEKKKNPLEGLKKGLLHWCSDEQGGHLTKVAAQDLAHHIQVGLLSQEGMEGFPPLSDFWVKKKKSMGAYMGDPKEMGIATGDMVKAIKPIDWGTGQWKVGISKNERVSRKIGSYDRVLPYALLFEFGSAEFGIPDIVHSQPPRPFFMTSFIQWTNERLPSLLKETIWNDIYDKLQDLMGRGIPNDPMSMAYVTFGEGASEEVMEMFREQAGEATAFYPSEQDLETKRGLYTRKEKIEAAYRYRQEKYGEKAEAARKPLGAGFTESERIRKGIEYSHSSGMYSIMHNENTYVWNEAAEFWEDAVSYFTREYGG